MDRKKQLYCCSSYYQLLISLMKALTQAQRVDLVLEEHGIETARLLAPALVHQMAGCVDQVFVCPDSEKIDPYRQRCASFLPWQRRQVLRHMEKVFEEMAFRERENFAKEKEDFAKEYEKIHVFWDLGYAGTYLNIRRIPYTLHEDSLNSYQHIRENRPNYRYIFEPKGWKFRLKKHFRIGVIPFGYSDCCDAVEVNEKAGIEILPDKVREAPRAELEKALTKEQKKKLFDLFMAGVEMEEGWKGDTVLLLTEPFALTGRLPSVEAQVKLYRDILEQYEGKGQVYLKPHPRDTVDYRKYFPKVMMMEKNIPMEVLNFNEHFQVSRAITVTSSAVWGIHCAGEKIYLGREFLGRYTLG